MFISKRAVAWRNWSQEGAEPKTWLLVLCLEDANYSWVAGKLEISPKKVPLKSSLAAFLQYICRVEVQVQFLQFWLMSKVSHPLGEWFASILSQLLLVCRFCLCNWDKLSPIKGFPCSLFVTDFLPSTNKLARISFSSDWWLPGVTNGL